MNKRASLIARKQEVLGELARARRQLEAASQSGNPQQRQQLESRIEQLMAEEQRLRVSIDRAR